MKNEALAVDVLSCLDQMKTLLECKQCVNFSKIAKEATPINDNEEEAQDEEEAAEAEEVEV